MNQQQQRAERDARLYNTDGRFYDASEAPDVLEVRARLNVSLSPEWRALAVVVLLVACVNFAVSRIWISTPGNDLQNVALQVLLTMLLMLLMRRWVFFRTLRLLRAHHSSQWVFNRSRNQLHADNSLVAPLDDVVAVEGFKRWGRFFLELRLRDSRRVRLGGLGYASKEWAWRQDASTIAEFLNVPLVIPEP